jgi:polyisoprenoid-binding protein YceI
MREIEMSATADSVAGTGNSSAGTWKIDPSHSGVTFTVTHLMISKVRGNFGEVSGTVETDGTPEGSRIDAEIGVGSIDTRDAGRDTHLRSADFFDVAKYPKIHFVSTSVKAKDDSEFRVFGNLTIRDVTRPVEMDVTREGSGRDPWGNNRAGFSATLKIDRRDFGLTWNQALETGGVMVSNEVKLSIDVELTHAVQ